MKIFQLRNLYEMTFWRQAGVNYIRYSQIAAKAVRKCLKPEMRAEAAKREGSTLKFTKWDQGKPIKGAKVADV